MLQHVNTVLTGSAFVAATPTKGQIVLLGAKGNILTLAADAAKEDTVSLALCTGTMQIVDPTKTDGSMITKPTYKQSSPIQRYKLNVVAGNYTAPVMATAAIDLSAATIAVDVRYVVRIIYKDIHEGPGQFTHTYEVISKGTAAADIVNEFAATINRHPGRRVTAAANGSILNLTALEVNDNNGVDSINEYSIVSMDVSLYQTLPFNGILSSQPYAVPGATVEVVEGNPGKGYWKQVRDMENRALGYAGIHYEGAYPEMKAAKYVTEGTTYNYVTVEYENKYLSNDNQYIKNTPLTVDVFCTGATTTLVSMLAAFEKGE